MGIIGFREFQKMGKFGAIWRFAGRKRHGKRGLKGGKRRVVTHPRNDADGTCRKHARRMLGESAVLTMRKHRSNYQ